VDDVLDIARVGRNLLRDPDSGADGLQALTQHNREGLANWRSFLG
jgi:hypothetical protein